MNGLLASIIASVSAIIATLGGWEAIKYFLNRKANARKIEAEADSVEFTVLKETCEFLQTQLQEKEKRFAEQTNIIRSLTKENLGLNKRVTLLETERAMKLCERRNCAQREPQSGY